MFITTIFINIFIIHNIINYNCNYIKDITNRRKLTVEGCIPNIPGAGFKAGALWLWNRFSSFSRWVSANFTTSGDLQPFTYAYKAQ